MLKKYFSNQNTCTEAIKSFVILPLYGIADDLYLLTSIREGEWVKVVAGENSLYTSVYSSIETTCSYIAEKV